MRFKCGNIHGYNNLTSPKYEESSFLDFNYSNFLFIKIFMMHGFN